MIDRCVACCGENFTVSEIKGVFEIGTCADCGMQFTKNPDAGTEQYRALYEKNTDTDITPNTVAHTYDTPQTRLALENAAIYAPRPRLIPAEAYALEWIKKKFPKNSLIMEIGCGTGRFLQSLKVAGYRCVGVEVSDEINNSLRRRGFDIVTGEAPTFDWRGEMPAAIVFFEVLEHIANPETVIAPLKRRFPKTVFIASVPSPFRVPIFLKNKREETDFPPHHYLRWTPAALEVFFKRIGFANVYVRKPDPDGYELLDFAPFFYRLNWFNKIFIKHKKVSKQENGTTSKKRLLLPFFATMILCAHAIYQNAIKIIGMPMALKARKKGASAGSMVVIASD